MGRNKELVDKWASQAGYVYISIDRQQNFPVTFASLSRKPITIIVEDKSTLPETKPLNLIAVVKKPPASSC